MSNLIGQSLGRYHILEQLGEGGMATVYKAYDTRLEREVALKVIRRDAIRTENYERFLKRFEREAKLAAQLSHPNIVRILDYGERAGIPYIVMEHIPGGTLKQQLTGQPIPWEEAVQILLPIARALEYAHTQRQKIIHRDVKPANILLTQSGEPMLSDFGIAKALESEETVELTGTGIGLGTYNYMAPEQGMGEKVDQRADIYALGVVLYEMVTGHVPYRADTPMAVMVKKATDPLPPPTRFVPGLPDETEKVLRKALAKDPQDRYPTMEAFAEGMERLLSEAGKVAPDQTTSRTRLPSSSQETILQGTDTEVTRDQGPITAPPPVTFSSKLPLLVKTRRWLTPIGIGATLLFAFSLIVGLVLALNGGLKPNNPPSKTQPASAVLPSNAPTTLQTVTSTPVINTCTPTTIMPPPTPVVAKRTTSSEINTISSIWIVGGIDNPGDILSPGSRYYEMSVDPRSSLRWTFYWCTSDSSTMSNNLDYMAVDLLINDVPLGADRIYQYTETSSSWYCHYWSTTLSDWMSGAIIQLMIHYSFSQAVNDGYSSYPAGDYYLHLKVTVR